MSRASEEISISLSSQRELGVAPRLNYSYLRSYDHTQKKTQPQLIFEKKKTHYLIHYYDLFMYVFILHFHRRIL